MIAMMFEYWLNQDHIDAYKAQSAMLHQLVTDIDGFISIEVYKSVADPDKLLALGFFENEEAVQQWRNLSQHRTAQSLGRQKFFTGYRLRMADVSRDYGMFDRQQVPTDSQSIHQNI